MVRVYEVRLELDENEAVLKKKCEKILGGKVDSIKLVKKSIDARRKKDVFYSCTVDCEFRGRVKETNKIRVVKNEAYTFPSCTPSGKTVIVGTGPAGLFAGLMLARAGFEPLLLERGGTVDERVKKTEIFFTGGVLDTETNIQFGEGGAGTFSDGKLNTGINDVRIKAVLEEFVRFGAPEEILYDAMPHIGTDILRNVVKNIREEIIRLGGRVMFNTKLTGIETENGEITAVNIENAHGKAAVPCDGLILAIGHSSRDTVRMLYSSGLEMKSKPFSVGVRIEHKQSMINKAMYGDFADRLPPAPYKLWTHLPDGRSLYTFCMCPGGFVVNASSQKGRLVTNGMSNYAREGENANSALLVNVTGGGDALSGINIQEDLEEKAFRLGGGNYNMPVQLLGDFLSGTETKSLGNILPTVRPGYKFSDFRELFPDYILETLKGGILEFDKKLHGFADKNAVMTAPETRSSSPVSVIRDKDSFATSIKGVYSAGEGGGHAGGITSSAVDGIKNAEALALYLRGGKNG